MSIGCLSYENKRVDSTIERKNQGSGLQSYASGAINEWTRI